MAKLATLAVDDLRGPQAAERHLQPGRVRLPGTLLLPVVGSLVSCTVTVTEDGGSS